MSISQDGDALFPLIAMDRKSAFWATVINTIPAIIVGVDAYLIETRLRLDEYGEGSNSRCPINTSPESSVSSHNPYEEEARSFGATKR